VHKTDERVVRRRATWILVVSLLLGGVIWSLQSLITGPGTAASFAGDAPGIFNVPAGEPILERYDSLGDYSDLARSGVLLASAGLLLLALGAGAIAARPGLLRAQARLATRVGPTLLWVLSALTGTALLGRLGYWSDWYPVKDAMALESIAPFSHRVLLPLVARGIGALFGTDPHGSFLASQFLVLLALFPVTARWCALFSDRRTGVLATLSIFLLLLSTSYFTFYDLGIVLFFTLGLYLLATNRIIAYLVMLPVATLNHEIILFLILVSGAMRQPFRPNSRYDWAFVTAQVCLYAVTRAALFYVLPEESASALGNIWVNLHFLVNARFSVHMAQSVFVLLWMGVSLLGLSHAPPFLRNAAWIAALLLMSTLVVGQVNEARQFVAFTPVAIALLLCLLRSIEPDGGAQATLLNHMDRP
jgi:hypothetical protein